MLRHGPDNKAVTLPIWAKKKMQSLRTRKNCIDRIYWFRLYKITECHRATLSSFHLLHHYWHQAASYGCHERSSNQGCLHAVGLMQFLGSHTSHAEEEEAGQEEHGLVKLLVHHTITGAPSQQGAHISEVASEVGGANRQSLAPSGDAILDALGECEQQQALRGVVVAFATVLLAVVDQASGHHCQGRGQEVGRVSARVDQLAIRLAVACEEGSEAEGQQEVSKLGTSIHDQTSGVAGVAALMAHRHAHFEDAQGVDQTGGEAQDVLDHLEGEVVAVAELKLWGHGLLSDAQTWTAR
eukprot:Skav203387  [mRNA]  locus=scaffold1379:574500:575484:- [translate_table: standard]